MKGFGSSNSVLGIDIGTHSIKLVEVRYTSKKPVITYARSVPIPHTGDGPVWGNEEVILSLLQTAVDESKLRRKKVVTAVPSAFEEQVTMRSIFIPDLPLNVSQEALHMSIQTEFKAQDYIAYDDDAQIGFHVEGEETQNGSRGLQVFVVAVHRELIEKRMQMLKECDLVPIAIDVDFLALVRLIVHTSQLSEEDDIALLDIGETKTDVGFYQHGKLYPYPHVPFAGFHLTSQVAQHLNVEWEEAQTYKQVGVWEDETSIDIGNADKAAIWDALEASLDQELYQQFYGRFDAYITMVRTVLS